MEAVFARTGAVRKEVWALPTVSLALQWSQLVSCLRARAVRVGDDDLCDRQVLAVGKHTHVARPGEEDTA